jgi:hypothetical protein
MINIRDINPQLSKFPPTAYPCIYKTPPIVINSAENAEKRGHGLGSTR